MKPRVEPKYEIEFPSPWLTGDPWPVRGLFQCHLSPPHTYQIKMGAG